MMEISLTKGYCGSTPKNVYCLFLLLTVLVGIPQYAQSFTPTTTTVSSRIPRTTKTISHHVVNSRTKSNMLLFSSSSPSMLSASTENNHQPKGSVRDRLRQVTGFSLTAFRATMRAATGISFTAIYAATLATTSAFVRKVMAIILAPFPTWFRYFLQPFLVLYYTPLFILRNLTGPTRKRARDSHEHFIEGWKNAVKAAEDAQEDGYWPVHVNDDGVIEAVLPPKPEKANADGTSFSNNNIDLIKGIEDSVEVVMEKKMSQNNNKD